MDGLLWVDVLFRITHVLSAIALAGGSLFIAFVLHPVMSQTAENMQAELTPAIMARWKRFVHAGVALLLISGLYNFVQAIPLHRGDSLYHALLGIKMLLGLLIFAIASILVGRSRRTDAIRQRRSTWLKGVLVLAIIVVGISGFVKVRGTSTANAANVLVE